MKIRKEHRIVHDECLRNLHEEHVQIGRDRNGSGQPHVRDKLVYTDINDIIPV
jgi:hypothetical protein